MEVEDEGVVLHTVKTCRGSGGVAPLIPTFGSRWRCVVTLRPGRITSGKEAGSCSIGGWAGIRAGLTFWEERKISCLFWDWNLGTSSAKPSYHTDYAIRATPFGK